MNKLVPLLMLLTVFSSCGKKYKIEGLSSVSSLDGKVLFIKAPRNGNLVAIDSAEVVHGKFCMHGQVDSVEMVTLFVDDESIMPMVLEGGQIQISITNSQLVVKGTPLNDVLYEFISKKNVLDSRIGELGRKEAKMILDGVDPVEIQVQLQKEGEDLLKEMNTYVKKFISDNYENVLGPNVFLMMCTNFPYPLLTPEMEELIKNAPAAFKENASIREYVSKARGNMKMIHEDQSMRADRSGESRE